MCKKCIYFQMQILKLNSTVLQNHIKLLIYENKMIGKYDGTSHECMICLGENV